MAISLLEQGLLHYFTRFKEPQKRSLPEMIRTFISAGDDPFQPVSLEQYNKKIDEAMKRMDAGEFYTHEEVVETSKSWINEKQKFKMGGQEGLAAI